MRSLKDGWYVAGADGVAAGPMTRAEMQSASARGGFPPDALVWHVEIAEVEELIAGLTPANHALAVEIAQIPEHIRGYGHVKEAHLATARTRWSELMAAWRMPKAERGAA